MADVKITDYDAIVALADADLIEVVDDVAGTPTSKKSTWTTIKAFLKTYFDGLYAGKGANTDITSLGALSGAQTIPTIALTGGQIAFPATAVPSAGANTLDDYEEGSWTPDLQFGGAKVGITYGTNTGYYTKIGQQVSVTAWMVLTSKGSSNGDVTLAGLPFTIANNNAAYSSVSLMFNNISFANIFEGCGVKNTNYIEFKEITEAGVLTTLTDANFINWSWIKLSMTYFI